MTVVAMTAATSAAAPRWAFAQTTRPAAATRPATGPSDEGERLATAALDRRLSTSQREEAARRMVQRRDRINSSAATLHRMLRAADDKDGQAAAAHALADQRTADTAWIDDLAALLGPDRNLTDAAAQALSLYKGQERVFRILEQFAQDRNGPAPSRTAVIRAMGQFVEPYAARSLFDLLSDGDQPPAIRNAAADALIELTGLAANGREVDRWRQWMTANASKPPAQWKADLTDARAARFDQLRERNRDLVRELEGLLRSQYQDAPNDQKPAVVMRFLRSPAPDVRGVGADLVARLAGVGGQVTEEMQDRLVEMIGDSSPRVRLAVADALRALNSAKALDALLAQLPAETDGDVRAAFIRVLGRSANPRAVDPLLALLNDPTPLSVRQEAAEALAELGPQIRQDARAADAAANRLWDQLKRLTRSEEMDADRYRDALGEALARIGSSRNASEAARMLADPHAQMRVIALRLLGAAQDPRSATVVGERIRDEQEDPEVRKQALETFGQVATPVEATLLYPYLNPAQQRNESIRAAAWRGFQSLMQKMSPEQLLRSATEFKRFNDPEKRIAVLEMLSERLKAAGPTRGGDWAEQKENVAADYAQLQRWQLSAERYREAIDFRLANGGKVDDPQIENLFSKRITALLKNKQYDDAARVGAEAIRSSSTLSPAQTVGAVISREASLLNNQNALPDAKRLIEAALRMQPRLDASYRESLSATLAEVDRKLAGKPK